MPRLQAPAPFRLDDSRYNEYYECMAGRLQREIKQSKPFRNLHAEAYLNLLKTADVLEQAMSAGMKAYGISGTQYNVLRILRGARPDGLACSEIGSRMI